MAYTSNLVAVMLTMLLVSTMVPACKLESGSTLSARLKLSEEGSSSCWDAMFELQSCSGEVVLFFINGETQLGPRCCDAIRIIEHQCWPSMLGSLGITTEEGDILLGYCDASPDLGSSPGSTTLNTNLTTCHSLSP